MEWWIGLIVILAIIAVLWWLLNRNSGGRRGGDSPESLDHAPSTYQHGFSDIGQQAPATFSNHDAARPSAGPGLGGAAAMHRDEAAARHDRSAAGSAESKRARGSSRVRPAADSTPDDANAQHIRAPDAATAPLAGSPEVPYPGPAEAAAEPDVRTEPEPDNPQPNNPEPDHAAGADEHRQGSGVDPATENASGDHTGLEPDADLPSSDPNDDDGSGRSSR